MKSIWVTGSAGQLGLSLQQAASNYPDSQFWFTDVAELDITDRDAIHQFMQTNRPQVVINAAAYTQVDKAEEDKALAHLVNAEAVRHLAQQCRQHNALLLHLSTDFVFDGAQGRPYVESDGTNPLGVYGATKRQGEEWAIAEHEKTIILRTAWVYAEHGKNFLQTMLRLGAERDMLHVVNDQIGSPTYTGDLAELLLFLAHQSSLGGKYGLYHYTNEGAATWYDFACAIMEYANLSCKVLPIPTRAYPTPAKRPHFSYLSKEKIKDTFNLTIPHWRQRLKEVILQAQ